MPITKADRFEGVFMRTTPLRVVVLTLALLSAVSALAHSALVRARPAAGSRVPKSPPRVELWFTEEIESAFSSVAVFDAGGHEVDNRDAAVRTDKKILAVSIPPLSPGRYKAAWHVVAVDTHKAEGSFPFVVSP
jgi:methionine-rich copper-binding protein CopC